MGTLERREIFMSRTDVTKRNSVLAAGAVLFLCMSAVFAVRFRTYDPATSADSDTLFDYCIFAGMVLLPVASVCFAKSLFVGRRFRFSLSWLVGFLMSWVFLLKAQVCLGSAIFGAIITLIINGFDSLVERLLAKLDNLLPRNWLFLFVAHLVGTILLSSLIVVLLSAVAIAL